MFHVEEWGGMPGWISAASATCMASYGSAGTACNVARGICAKFRYGTRVVNSTGDVVASYVYNYRDADGFYSPHVERLEG